MSDAPVVRYKLASLIAWRDSVLETKRPAHALPSDSDLVAIARCDEVSRAALSTLELERPSAAISYSAGVLSALRIGQAAHAAGEARPTLPSEWHRRLEGEATRQPKKPAQPELQVKPQLHSAHVLASL